MSAYEGQAGQEAQAKQILVVDDASDTAGALATLLEFEGYEVRTARDGAEALRSVHAGAPDLILLDLWMPVMNGWEFLRALRSLPGEHSRVPVVVMTADSRAAKQDLPVQKLMLKPLDLDTVLSVVRQ